MDDPVAVALEGVARAAASSLVFGVPASAAPARIGRERRERPGAATGSARLRAARESLAVCDALYLLARLACPGKCRDVGAAELVDELLRLRARVSNGPTSRRLRSGRTARV